MQRRTYAQVSVSCESMTVQPRSRGELVLVTGLFTCYTHVYMKVLNCGRMMIRVVLVLHVHIRGYMYMGVLRILLVFFHYVLYWEMLGCNETFLQVR
jgi:hypothetical protein